MIRTPLKRTPFRRSAPKAQGASVDSSTPLDTGRKPLPRRSALKRISPKRQATLAARRSCVEQVIERDGGCVFGRFFAAAGIPVVTECSGPLTAHEPAKRSHGADPTNPDEAVALCRRHHEFAHHNVRIAEGVGLLERAAGYPIRHVNLVGER